MRKVVDFVNGEQVIRDELPGELPEPEDPLIREREGMVVSRFQAKAALLQVGLLSQVEMLLAGGADPLAQLAWNEAQEFQRNSPTITYLASHPSIGLSATDLDNLFRLAATIRA